MDKQEFYTVSEITTTTENVQRQIPLTDWISIETPPVRRGWYDTKTPEGLEHADRHWWEDGEFWEFGSMANGILKVKRSVKVSAYRGLTEKAPLARRVHLL